MGLLLVVGLIIVYLFLVFCCFWCLLGCCCYLLVHFSNIVSDTLLFPFFPWWCCLLVTLGKAWGSAPRVLLAHLWLPAFWPLVCSFCFVLLFCMFMACISPNSRVWMLPSDKVTKLITESVLVDAVAFDFVVFAREVLFLAAWVCFIVVVAMDLNVDIDPVDNRSSCIFAMVLASVFAPAISRSSLVSGKMRSIL